MKKPSEQIGELVERIALDLAEKAASKPTADFMMKVTGTTLEDAKKAMQTEPFTWITAILQYLDETADKPK